jgi:hypothetical protein
LSPVERRYIYEEEIARIKARESLGRERKILHPKPVPDFYQMRYCSSAMWAAGITDNITGCMVSHGKSVTVSSLPDPEVQTAVQEKIVKKAACVPFFTG